MSEHTREFCSRQGRELMSSVLAQHPGVFSALLQKTADSIKHVGRVRTVTVGVVYEYIDGLILYSARVRTAVVYVCRVQRLPS